MQAHGNSPEWVRLEALRRFPLDLPARIAWMREAAHATLVEEDRHAIYQAIRRMRNGA